MLFKPFSSIVELTSFVCQLVTDDCGLKIPAAFAIDSSTRIH